MARKELFDDSVSRWLEETAPPRIPERVLRATFERTRTSRQQAGWRALLGRLTMPKLLPALGSAAVIVVVAALALNFYANQQSGIGTASPTPTATSPAPTAAASAEPTAPTVFRGMWPQSTDEDVRRAQELADAGDPNYTWQVSPALSADLEGWPEYLTEPGAPIVERFLSEVLGWDAYMIHAEQAFKDVGGDDGSIRGLVFLRCVAGEPNPLYPAERCAPTIDDLRFETVSIDLLQPERRGPDGIWVVSSSVISPAPFAQVDSRVAQAEAEAQLEEFLQARVDGEGADGLASVPPFHGLADIPLLYATTDGSTYERYEFELVAGPNWPDAEMAYEIRLYADGGNTVVEQFIDVDGGSFSHDPRRTTENGQPVPVTFEFFDGQVSINAPYPWDYEGDLAHWWRLSPENESFSSPERIEPVAALVPVGEGCALGATPADAEALARAIESDPDLEASTPMPVTLGGNAGLSMDVSVARETSDCDAYSASLVLTHEVTPGNRRELEIANGNRMRLFLFDSPEGSSLGVVGLAVQGPESRFEDLLDEIAPILESFELRAP
jgi:hypothetical protein